MNTPRDDAQPFGQPSRANRRPLDAEGLSRAHPDEVERLLSVFFARSVHALVLATFLAPLASCGDEDLEGMQRENTLNSANVPDASVDSTNVPNTPVVGTRTPTDAGAGAAFTSVPCLDGQFSPRIDEFTLSFDADFIGLVQAWPQGPWDYEAERGEKCEGATNREACELAFSRVRMALGPTATEPCAVSSCRAHRYVVTTAGDEARGFGAAELPELLGPIDSAAEAWYLASFRPDAPTPICSTGSHGERVGAEREVADGFELRGIVQDSWCNPIQTSEVTYHVGRDGSVKKLSSMVVSSMPGCMVAGRRPAGLLPSLARTRGRFDSGAESSASGALGRVFARMAYLEAASVDAFEQLERELAALGAPPALVAGAQVAQLEERDHTARMRCLAERFGGEIARVVVAPRALRGAFELALDNAVEGCVRETFGALLATYQAERAGDMEIRATMRIVARDETRHAALSWQVFGFLDSRLSDSERAQIAAMQRAELIRLEREIEEPSQPERELLGSPTRSQALALLRSLWPLVASDATRAA